MINRNSGKHNIVNKNKFNKYSVRLLSFCFLMVCCFLYVTKVNAQDASSDPLRGDSYVNINNAVRNSSAFGGGAGNNRLGNMGSLTGEVPNLPFDMFVAEGVKESGAEEPLLQKQGSVKSKFHTYIPKKQFNSMIDSDEWETMYNNAIRDSRVGMIYTTTWGLANSAVGQARYNAIMQSQKAIANHYLAELSFVRQVEQYTHLKQKISDAYFSCVRAKMSNNGDDDQAMTWYEAQEACMGDDNSSNSNNNTGGKGADATQFTFEDTEDHSESNNNNNNVICLTDYMTAQENSDAGGDIETILKTSYQAYIGDIKFELDDPQNKDRDGASSAVREVTYKYESPDSSGDCISSSNNDSPYDLYKKALEYRYKELVKVLKNYCSNVRYASGGEESEESKITVGSAVKKRKDFEDSNKDFFSLYTIPGYTLNSQILDNIVDLIVRSGKRGGNAGKIDCDQMFNDTFGNVDQADNLLTNAYIQDGANGSYRYVVYMLAAAVTRATMIQSYETIFSYLSRTTLGSMANLSDTFNMAISQINSTMESTVKCNIGNAKDEKQKISDFLNKLTVALNNYQSANQTIIDIGKNIVGQGSGEYSLTTN